VNFDGQTAVVTGSGRGIGKAIALRLASEGADIVVNFFRNRAPAEAAAAEIRAMGRRALVVRADVGEAEGIETLLRATEAEFGGLDILICNAASGFNRPVMEQKIRGWDWTMNINARSALFMAQGAVRLMDKRGGGFIVNISSPGADRVMPDYVVVGASKAALEAVTRYLGVELAPHNITVNAVSPGIVDTDALRHFAALRGDQAIDNVAKATPAGRLVLPEEVAELVAFLCTPAARMIIGQTILMDGGASLPMRGPADGEAAG
jgi:enoyl-[acyl-carrier protein] reductase III